jgi:hypothetical protein
MLARAINGNRMQRGQMNVGYAWQASDFNSRPSRKSTLNLAQAKAKSAQSRPAVVQFVIYLASFNA